MPEAPRRLAVLAALTLGLVSAGPAVPALAQELGLDTPYVRILNQYAEIEALLAACGTPHDNPPFGDLAEVISEAQYPGYLDWLTGRRADYAEKITEHARQLSAIQRVRGCVITPLEGSYLLLMRASAREILKLKDG